MQQMSGLVVANSLMLDFRCVVLPRFVYAVGSHFENGKETDPKIKERQAEFAAEMVRVTAALKK